MTPPETDEVEVTVIGPGFGESILIHMGMQEWFVIDSCLDSTSSRPAALPYLEGMNVDPACDVKGILATHWHDDHIGGMSQLLNVCRGAQFTCAPALTKREFVEVATLYNKNRITLGSTGLTEIQEVLRLLRKREISPQYAMAHSPIFTRAGAPLPAQITALSPCNEEYNRFLRAIASLMPGATTKQRCPDLSPNDLSVAVWVKVGSIDILLGADLEEHNVATRGWSAVISSPHRPLGKGLLFKISHHGSITGHHQGIWTSLLVPQAYSVLTPWNRGARKLPTQADCNRITALSPKSFATSQATASRSKSGVAQAVAKTLREANIGIKAAEPPTGFVQFRRKLNAAASDWTVELSKEAIALTGYSAGKY